MGIDVNILGEIDMGLIKKFCLIMEFLYSDILEKKSFDKEISRDFCLVDSSEISRIGLLEYGKFFVDLGDINVYIKNMLLFWVNVRNLGVFFIVLNKILLLVEYEDRDLKFSSSEKEEICNVDYVSNLFLELLDFISRVLFL